MNEKIKSKTILAAALTAVLTAVLASGASAQVAQAPAAPPAPGHSVVAESQPRLPHDKAIAVTLNTQDLSFYLSLLGGADSRKAKADYGELGMRRGAISKTSDGGLMLALIFPPSEQLNAAGRKEALTRLVRVDSQGRGVIKSRIVEYDGSCADVAGCGPLGTAEGVMQTFDAAGIMLEMKDFWQRAR